MSVVRAKFFVESIVIRANGYGTAPQTKTITEIKLRPVYGNSEENKMFWNATPAGELSLGTVNPAAAAAFEIGKQFYIDFTPAE